MVTRLTVIATRTSALAFRLAGASVVVPAPGAATTAFRAALEEGDGLVLLAPECAAELPPALLGAARRAARPLVYVLPGPGAARFDVVAPVRRALGLDP